MGILEFFDQYKCTKNEKEHLLDYLCTIRVKRVIKEINDLKINKNSIAMQIDINSRKQLNKPENYAAFYSLLNRLPTSDRDALKESIVSQYTEGRTTSLRDMTLKEYSAAVSAMQKLVPPTYQEQLRKILRQKRSAVLHQMQLLGIDTADWDRVNAFCRDSRIAGKEFRELDCEALDTLQVKLRAIRRKRENKQQ